MNDSNAPDNQLVTATVCTFPSAHHAFQAEKVCQEAGLPILIIPIPREITADCGVALLFAPAQRQRLELLLEEAGVNASGFYPVTRERSKARLWNRVLQL